MNQRPVSITVISWILIVIGTISLISTTAMLNNAAVLELMAKSPLPIPVQHALSYAGLLVTMVCGIAMLKGKNWARLLYVIWGVIGFVIGIATAPMKAAMIPGFVIFAVIVFFLFRPKATAFFVQPKTAENA